MTVAVSKVYLLEDGTGEAVEAELRDAIEQAQIDDWAKHWIPAILAAIQDLEPVMNLRRERRLA